jgi:hypothetical protein
LVQEPESGVEVVGLMTRAIPRAEVDLGRFFPRVLHLLNRSHGLWSGGSVPVPKVESSPRDRTLDLSVHTNDLATHSDAQVHHRDARPPDITAKYHQNPFRSYKISLKI